MPQLKNTSMWRRTLIFVILKQVGNAIRGRKQLSLYIPTVCPFQDPRETHLHSCQTNHQPITPRGTSRFLTWEVDHRSGHLTDGKRITFQIKKVGAVFFELTAANNTVWHHSLICKLLRLLPDKHMVHMIMVLVGKQSQLHPYHR